MFNRSLACTVVEMLTGYPPYYGQAEILVAVLIANGGNPPYVLPDGTSDEAKNFLRRCFQFERKDRPTASELLSDPFINGYGFYIAIFYDEYNTRPHNPTLAAILGLHLSKSHTYTGTSTEKCFLLSL